MNNVQQNNVISILDYINIYPEILPREKYTAIKFWTIVGNRSK
jgi:hypothetical protein